MDKKLSKSPRLNALLYKMGIFSNYDVINHLPKRYDDYSLTGERNLEDKQRVTVYGKVMSNPALVKGFHRVTAVSFELLTNRNTYFKVIAFNRPYLANIVKVNNCYTVVGTYDKKKNTINMINVVEGMVDQKDTLRPVYTLPKEFANKDYVRLVNKSFTELDGHIGSIVPLSLRKKYRLFNKENALKSAHHPSNYEELRQAYRYLKYEEALVFSLKNQLIKEENKSLSKIKKEPIDLSSCKDFLDTLPYELTEDQKKASEEIIEDMNQSSLMYRLLQGDVGTGKTLVSFVCMYANYVRGDQGALMAPTEVLAKQHYENAKKLFADTKIKIAYLVGSTPASEKKEIYRDIEEGYYDIIIGTHALFTKSIKYSSLGLVIIDEQHRFGVNQRKALLDKDEHADLLMMSATPIPRSLALSIYGDLEISTLYKFPNIKRDVTTKIVHAGDDAIYDYVGKYLENNRKIYVVAPIIEFSEDGRYSAEKLYARFVLKYGAKVGLLHGKMKANEKEEVLNKFAYGDIDILVSTQVIEVGIDVKSSSLMIIYDASSFGLASLHQLRGRIGRDGYPSICLLAVSDFEEADKLDILVKSNDGFEIAEKDLSLRGPGELVGLKQSGIPDFRFVNMIDDIKIFVVARDDAKEILSNKDNPEFEYIIRYCKRAIDQEEFIKA